MKQTLLNRNSQFLSLTAVLLANGFLSACSPTQPEMTDAERIEALKKHVQNVWQKKREPDLSETDLLELSREAQLLEDALPMQIHNKREEEKDWVKIGDITRWEMLDYRYVLGLGIINGEESPLAIYDLAYPNPLSGHFPRTVLGSIGFGSINLASLLDAIKRLWTDNDKGDVPANMDQDSREALEHLAWISRREGKRQISFPKKFWQKLKWQDGRQHIQAPEVINLGELDWQAMAKNRNDFNQQWNKIQGLFRELHDEDGDFDFLSALSLVKRTQDNETIYDIVFEPKNQTSENRYGKPLKVADFNRPNSSITKGVKLYLIQQAVKTLVDLIPEPVTNQVLGLVVSRWFSLYKMQLSSHFQAARHHLSVAEANSQPSPFTGFSHESRKMIGNYLVNYKTGAFSIVKQIFANKSKAWEYDMAGEAEDIEDSHKWMADAGWQFNALGPAYMQMDQSLYMLIPHWWWNKKPQLAINLEHPHRKLWSRNTIEFLDIALKFVELPIPFADDLIQMAFDEAVRKEDKSNRRHEYALSVYLQAREQSLCEDWSAYSQYLTRNRLIPFEVGNAKELEIITHRRLEYGITGLSEPITHCQQR